MQSTRPKMIIVYGPTASGKSDVAIRLAKKFDGEVISADSRQIYRQMNIGTGKISRDIGQENSYFSEEIRHHLIDIVYPMEDFNVSHFKKYATEAIEDILSRGKLPIICGGTCFWISALTENMILPKVEPNKELRNKLRNKSTEELFSLLSSLDYERTKTIDRNNPVRLVRAIEIATALGTVPKPSICNPKSSYSFLKIGINVPKEVLNEKIKKRLEQRFNEGMIAEVEGLHNPPAGQGVSWGWMEKIGLEYRWIARYLQNKISLKEMKEKLYFDIIHYAKRQMTWLKRDNNIIWLNNYSKIEDTAAKFLQK